MSKILKDPKVLPPKDLHNSQPKSIFRKPILPAMSIVEGGSAQIITTDHAIQLKPNAIKGKLKALTLQVYTRMEVEEILCEEITKFDRESSIQKEEVRNEAVQEGKIRGFEEGRREGLEEGKKKALETIKRLEEFMVSIESGWEKMLHSSEVQIIQLSCTLAGFIAFDDEFLRPSTIIETLKHSSPLLLGEKELKINLHPSEMQEVQNAVPEIFSTFEKPEKIKIVTDEKIRPGGCIIETEFGKIDATVEARWKVLIRQALGVKNEV